MNVLCGAAPFPVEAQRNLARYKESYSNANKILTPKRDESFNIVRRGVQKFV
jgi:hypothetical protein